MQKRSLKAFFNSTIDSKGSLEDIESQIRSNEDSSVSQASRVMLEKMGTKKFSFFPEVKAAHNQSQDIIMQMKSTFVDSCLDELNTDSLGNDYNTYFEQKQIIEAKWQTVVSSVFNPQLMDQKVIDVLPSGYKQIRENLISMMQSPEYLIQYSMDDVKQKKGFAKVKSSSVKYFTQNKSKANLTGEITHDIIKNILIQDMQENADCYRYYDKILDDKAKVKSELEVKPLKDFLKQASNHSTIKSVLNSELVKARYQKESGNKSSKLSKKIINGVKYIASLNIATLIALGGALSLTASATIIAAPVVIGSIFIGGLAYLGKSFFKKKKMREKLDTGKEIKEALLDSANKLDIDTKSLQSDSFASLATGIENAISQSEIHAEYDVIRPHSLIETTQSKKKKKQIGKEYKLDEFNKAFDKDIKELDVHDDSQNKKPNSTQALFKKNPTYQDDLPYKRKSTLLRSRKSRVAQATFLSKKHEFKAKLKESLRTSIEQNNPSLGGGIDPHSKGHAISAVLKSYNIKKFSWSLETKEVHRQGGNIISSLKQEFMDLYLEQFDDLNKDASLDRPLSEQVSLANLRWNNVVCSVFNPDFLDQKDIDALPKGYDVIKNKITNLLNDPSSQINYAVEDIRTKQRTLESFGGNKKDYQEYLDKQKQIVHKSKIDLPTKESTLKNAKYPKIEASIDNGSANEILRAYLIHDITANAEDLRFCNELRDKNAKPLKKSEIKDTVKGLRRLSYISSIKEKVSSIMVDSSFLHSFRTKHKKRLGNFYKAFRYLLVGTIASISTILVASAGVAAVAGVGVLTAPLTGALLGVGLIAAATYKFAKKRSAKKDFAAAVEIKSEFNNIISNVNDPSQENTKSNLDRYYQSVKNALEDSNVKQSYDVYAKDKLLTSSLSSKDKDNIENHLNIEEFHQSIRRYSTAKYNSNNRSIKQNLSKNKNSGISFDKFTVMLMSKAEDRLELEKEVPEGSLQNREDAAGKMLNKLDVENFKWNKEIKVVNAKANDFICDAKKEFFDSCLKQTKEFEKEPYKSNSLEENIGMMNLKWNILVTSVFNPNFLNLEGNKESMPPGFEKTRGKLLKLLKSPEKVIQYSATDTETSNFLKLQEFLFSTKKKAAVKVGIANEISRNILIQDLNKNSNCLYYRHKLFQEISSSTDKKISDDKLMLSSNDKKACDATRKNMQDLSVYSNVKTSLSSEHTTVYKAKTEAKTNTGFGQKFFQIAKMITKVTAATLALSAIATGSAALATGAAMAAPLTMTALVLIAAVGIGYYYNKKIKEKAKADTYDNVREAINTKINEVCAKNTSINGESFHENVQNGIQNAAMHHLDKKQFDSFNPDNTLQTVLSSKNQKNIDQKIDKKKLSSVFEKGAKDELEIKPDAPKKAKKIGARFSIATVFRSIKEKSEKKEQIKKKDKKDSYTLEHPVLAI